MSKEEYATHLDENIRDLHRRLRTQKYRHQPIRRVHIPKGPGSRETRPIGISTIEDKIVQGALREVLEAIYEQDFLPCSFGFRPKRSAHDALGVLHQMFTASEPVGPGSRYPQLLRQHRSQEADETAPAPDRRRVNPATRLAGAEFSPDGQYLVSASKDKTIHVRRADGTGEPVILVGHDQWITKARFSPDGRSIVSASDDHTVRVWHDLAPPTLDARRLWTATSYCMPIERRRQLLGVSEEQAQRDRQRCLERVEQARHAEMAGHNAE